MTGEARIFREALNGYGFEEAEQTPEGLFCEGCLTSHKRPTKMYFQSNPGTRKYWCRHAVVRFFNPEEDTGWREPE